MTEPLNRYQLSIAREEAEKILAGPEQDQRGWMRHEMAGTILSLLDMVPAQTTEPQSPSSATDALLAEVEALLAEYHRVSNTNELRTRELLRRLATALREAREQIAYKARAAYRRESEAEAVEMKRRIAAEAALETAQAEVEQLRTSIPALQRAAFITGAQWADGAPGTGFVSYEQEAARRYPNEEPQP